jgi:hypothetical protein
VEARPNCGARNPATWRAWRPARLGGGGSRGAFGPLALERVIAADIQRQLARLKVQDMVDHIVEQVTLMADHQQRAG